MTEAELASCCAAHESATDVVQSPLCRRKLDLFSSKSVAVQPRIALEDVRVDQFRSVAPAI